MSQNINKLQDDILSMSLLDLAKLTTSLEKKLNITKHDLNQNLKPKNESVKIDSVAKSEFTVMLQNFGKNKIGVIKTIRSLLGLGLRESKNLVEKAPVIVKAKIGKIEATKIEKMLIEVGASVKIQ